MSNTATGNIIQLIAAELEQRYAAAYKLLTGHKVRNWEKLADSLWQLYTNRAFTADSALKTRDFTGNLQKHTTHDRLVAAPFSLEEKIPHLIYLQCDRDNEGKWTQDEKQQALDRELPALLAHIRADNRIANTARNVLRLPSTATIGQIEVALYTGPLKERIKAYYRIFAWIVRMGFTNPSFDYQNLYYRNTCDQYFLTGKGLRLIRRILRQNGQA